MVTFTQQHICKPVWPLIYSFEPCNMCSTIENHIRFQDCSMYSSFGHSRTMYLSVVKMKKSVCSQSFRLSMGVILLVVCLTIKLPLCSRIGEFAMNRILNFLIHTNFTQNGICDNDNRPKFQWKGWDLMSVSELE